MQGLPLRRSVVTIVALGLFGIGVAVNAQSVSAISCFSVAGKMTCIDTAIPAASVPLPPVIVPSSGWGEGDDHQVVIEDNGGRHVARG